MATSAPAAAPAHVTVGDGGKAYPSAGILEITNAPPMYKSVEELPAYFGDFGGRFIPETLMDAHKQLEAPADWRICASLSTVKFEVAYVEACSDPAFREELEQLGKDFIGRPTPMYHAKRLSAEIGGAQIWFKREDLAHTGAHKINNAIGQALLAKRLGKHRIIAETGAGQHGVATATACAHLNLDCTVYMGAVDVQRQPLNVFRMKMLGARVVPVRSGSATLKDAINEALRDWVTNVDTTHYVIGSAIGPAPFPTIVKDLQSVIGRESREQILAAAGKLPHTVVACVGGGSNAIGMFAGFVDDAGVVIHGVEAGGHGVPALVAATEAVAAGGAVRAAGTELHDGVEVVPHSATITAGRPGVLHGTKTLLLQDAGGQIIETHSISAGLDYPGVGPEHAHLAATGRVAYSAVTDREALSALVRVSQTEGIIPALEPSHALFHALKLAETTHRDPADIILVNLCGRGDKDMQQVAGVLGVDLTDGVRTQATEVTPAAALAADTGAARRSALEADAAATAAAAAADAPSK